MYVSLIGKRQVVTFGSGQHGQLGHGNGWDYLKPKLVEALVNLSIIEVTAGSTTTCALTGTGTQLHPNRVSCGNDEYY